MIVDKIHYRPTATMPQDAARDLSRRSARLHRTAVRLRRPDINPNNGRHARWCSCLPAYVCEDHRLRR
jgi:hypothetical protein